MREQGKTYCSPIVENRAGCTDGSQGRTASKMGTTNRHVGTKPMHGQTAMPPTRSGGPAHGCGILPTLGLKGFKIFWVEITGPKIKAPAHESSLGSSLT